MTATTASPAGPASDIGAGHPFDGRARPHGPPRWSAPNVLGVVVGFVVFGPLGLFVLGWVLSGREVLALPGAARRAWHALFGGPDGDGLFGGAGRAPFAERSRTGNVVFDDYQRTQHERIREIRQEIAMRSRRFAEFRTAARRHADEAEFERFMASAPEAREGETDKGA